MKTPLNINKSNLVLYLYYNRLGGNMYEKYLKLKHADSSKLYLFKMGMFYSFLDKDAIEIAKYTTLKVIEHTKGVVKCSFPSNSYDKYMSIFKHMNLDVEVVENNKSEELDNYLDKIAKLDIDNICPIESLNILCKLKELI